MEAIELIMKIWGIEKSNRADLEQLLKTTSPELLGLALMNLASDPENEAFTLANDAWMAAHLPELKFT